MDSMSMCHKDMSCFVMKILSNQYWVVECFRWLSYDTRDIFPLPGGYCLLVKSNNLFQVLIHSIIKY